MDGIGNVDKIWIGYASDQTVRLNSSSGGIITGSLVALLESGVIDGAVVNVLDLDMLPWGKSILAKTKEELMQSSKSIYCVSEIVRGLNLVRDDPTVQKVAVVGLPCQISNLRQNMSFHNWLCEKVVICIGIMCGHNIYASTTIEALRESEVDINDVRRVIYRARGWYPFYYNVEMKDGSTKEFLWPKSPLQKTWDSLENLPYLCKICTDFAAEKADIACCDAWLEEYRGNQEGYSIVLTHTPLGTMFIENLIKENALILEPSSVEDLYRSNYMQIDRKLQNKKR